jgi:hypothetical protein
MSESSIWLGQELCAKVLIRLINSHNDFLVGAIELQRLSKQLSGINDKIKEKIDNYNQGKSEEYSVSQASVYTQPSDQDLDSDLADNVLFWKQIEQIHLTKLNLNRLINSLETLGTLDLSPAAYDILRPQWEEFNSIRRSQILRLRGEAILFAESIDSKFSLSILSKLNEVNHL